MSDADERRWRPSATRSQLSAEALRELIVRQRHTRTLLGRGMEAVIPESLDQQGQRQRRDSCVGRPVTYDTADYKNR